MAKRLKTTTYPEDKWWVTGEAQAGKSTFARAWFADLCHNQPQAELYLWPTDDRLWEYAQAIGDERVLMPEVDNTLDVTAVLTAIEQDLRGGDFAHVAGFVLDNMTHIFQRETGVTLKKTMAGQATSGAAGKAAAMRVVSAVLMSVQKPLLALSHTYLAATQNLKQKRKRDTISQVEEQRLKRCFNAKLEVLHQEERYGVQVVECRQQPGLQPFILWDEPGNYFAGMPARIRRALYDQPAAEQTTLTWDDFCKEVPFPRDNTQTIKANALWFGLNHCVERDGRKLYPFGDPNAEVRQANGQAGTNGAANRANNAYDKIYEGRHPAYPKPTSAGEMTVFWKQYCEGKLQAQIEAYERRKAGEPEEVSF